MLLEKRPFGATADGTPVTAYTLTSPSGCKAEVLDYGVTIRAILVPDRTGKLVDVALGYDTLPPWGALPTASPRDSLPWEVWTISWRSTTAPTTSTAAFWASNGRSGRWRRPRRRCASPWSRPTGRTVTPAP